MPVRRAGVYVPGGRAPVSVHRRRCAPSTARIAGVGQVAVCAPPGPGGRGAPADPRRVRAVRGQRGVPDGRSAGDRGARLRDRVACRPVDVIVGPGNPWVTEAKRQVFGQVGHRRAGRPERAARDRRRGRRRRARRARPARAGRARPRQPALADRARRGRCSRPSVDVRGADGARPAERDRRRAAGGPRVRPAHRAAGGRADRARAPPAGRRSTPRRSPRRCAAPAACSWAPGAATAFGDYVAGSNHVLPTGGAARFQSRALAGHLPAPHGSRILARRGARPPRARRRRPGPGRGLPRARRVDGAPRVSRTAHIHRVTGETDVSLSLGAGRIGRRRAPHRASASSTTCSTRWRGTAASTSTSRCRATSRPARTTRSRTRASRSGRRSTRRSATAPASAASATRSCRWTRRARRASIDVSGRPFTAFEGVLPGRARGGLRHRPRRGVHPRGGERGQADAARAGGGGRRTRTTWSRRRSRRSRGRCARRSRSTSA